jgi:heptaprenyl diphosphate synthase
VTTAYRLQSSDLDARLQERLNLVEQILRESVKSDYPFVTETSRHLVDAGGKRFRPMLVLLASEFGDWQSADVLRAAVVVELTHLATLYHDDVMDEADRRRGVDSANARWDNTVAILTGDFLFAKASEILADLGPEAVRIQARTFERLVTGQIKETIGPYEGVDAVAHHLQVLEDKTGSLIATSGRFGAMFAGCSESVVETLTLFGERIGVAFQLADDLVDLTSDDGESGKTQGRDLREGVQTMPALLALASERAEDARLQELVSRPLADEEDHAEALALLLAHDAVDQARAEAVKWANAARQTLDPLPDIPAKEALVALCDYVVTRTS